MFKKVLFKSGPNGHYKVFISGTDSMHVVKMERNGKLITSSIFYDCSIDETLKSYSDWKDITKEKYN